MSEIGTGTRIGLAIRQLISYANAYGQIKGPQNFTSATVSAYSNGEAVKRTTPNKNGFYVLSFLPEGNYQLTFDSPGFSQQNISAFLPGAGYAEFNVGLEKYVPEPESVPLLSVPSQAMQFGLIEVSLTKGGAPLAGELVLASTPAGETSLLTGTGGKAALNAAQHGTYNFTYAPAGLSASTIVYSAEPLPEDGTPETDVQAPVVIPPSQETGQGSGESALVLPVIGASVLVGIIGFAALIALVAIVVMRRGKGKSGGSAAEGSQSGGTSHEHPEHAGKKAG